MNSRLYRWRHERNMIKPEIIATLCGFSVDDLMQYESGCASIPDADRLALCVLFGDEFTIGQLLSSRLADDEYEILKHMDDAFRELLRWRAQRRRGAK